MGSLKYPAPPDIYESRSRSAVSGGLHLYAANWDSSSSSALHAHLGGFVSDRRKSVKGDVIRCCGFGVGSRWKDDCRNRFKLIVVHASEGAIVSLSTTEVVEECQTDNAAKMSASLTKKKAVRDFTEIHSTHSGNEVRRKSERRIWKRVAGMNKTESKDTRSSVCSRDEQSLEHTRNNQAEAALSAIVPESSKDQCNSVLKLLGKCNSEKTMIFFDWMKNNGKLKENLVAYNLALRALTKKDDWYAAEMLLQEMTSGLDCELNSEVFNILINICAKRGLVELGAKWFQVMLEKGVQPDSTTISLLMSLYQKNGSLVQAELTFGYMRSCKLQCVKAYSAIITIYTRLRMYDKAEEIISMMEQDEVLPNLENWLVRLNAYSQHGKLDEAEAVLKSMEDAGISPNIVAYNTLITGYGKASQPKAAKHLFQSLQNIGLEPDETTYRSMIEGFGRSNDYKEAMWYYKKLKNSGFQPSSSNFYTMINLQARHGDEIGAAQTLEDMRATGCQHSSIVSILLQAYQRVGKIKKIPLILNDSFYQIVLLDPTSCSILVMSYVQNYLLEDALRVLQEKRWKNSSFEDNLYHLLICSCKEAGHYENAVKIYTQMPKSDMDPNLHITCSMIDIYSAEGRFTEAKDLYLKLKSSGKNFDMIAYSIVVRMYVKSGSLKDACLVLDIMEKQKDIVPDKFLFLDMLRIYQQCSMLAKLENVYYWILRSAVPWDEAMYNCVINCCGHALPVDELSRLFDNMIQHGYAPNTNTYNVMLNIYGKAGLFKKAAKVFWMARKEHLADVISYNTIIAAYSQNKKLKSMRYFVQRMQNAGYSVSLEAYNCMLDAYGKEGLLEEFNEVLQKMEEASCASDHYTYNIMINIYGKRGWIEDVARVLAELREHGLEPDLYSYNTLIKAYGIAGMPEEAVNVVQEMRAKGIEPDRITYTNIITALQRNENFLEAVKWSLWMKQTGISS